ncbi:MAG: hypothetical protein WC683_07255 [bacterium]
MDTRSAWEVEQSLANSHAYPWGWYTSEDLALLSEAAKSAVHGTCEGALVEIGVYRGCSATALARQRQERQL